MSISPTGQHAQDRPHSPLARAPLGATALAVAAGLSLLLTAPPAWALATDARALAMGNAYSMVADEADMAAWNPALLAISQPNQHWFELTAPSVNLGLGNNFLSLNSLVNLLPNAKGQAASLSQNAVSSLLAGLPTSGWQIALDSGARAAIASPPLATSVMLETDADMQGVGIPHDLVQLLLEGNTGTPQVDISALDGATVAAIASAGISHAIALPHFLGKESALGVTVKYLQGLAYGTVTNATGSLATTDPLGEVSASASLEYQAAYPSSLSNLLSTGSGVAVDLGFVNQLDDQLRWGLMMGNLGYIKWNHIQDRIESVNQAPTGAGLSATGAASTPNFSNALKQTSGVNNGKSNIDGHLPPYARIGIAWEGNLGLPRTSRSHDPWSMPVIASLDAQQGFGEGYGISTTPELRIGLEVRPLGRWLPLRVGTTVGGDLPMMGAGFGIDLDRFRIDVAAGTMFGYFDNSAKGLYGTVTTNFAI